MPQQYAYHWSSDLHDPVRLKIINLEGELPITDVSWEEWEHRPSKHLFFTIEIWDRIGGKSLFPEVQSSFSDVHFKWDEWIELPIKYSELPYSSVIVLTLWDIVAPRRESILAGTYFSLYGSEHNFPFVSPGKVSRVLRRGRQRLQMWPHQRGDALHGTTPGKIKQESPEVGRLEKMVKRLERGQIPKVDWLDPITLQTVGHHQVEHRRTLDELEIHVELPTYDHPILFHEHESPIHSPVIDRTKESNVPFDPAIDIDEDPIEDMHRQLFPQEYPLTPDPNHLPNTRQRDRIQTILKYPITQTLTPEDKRIMWSFCHYLMPTKSALAKFLRCVDWNDPHQVETVSHLIPQWEPVGITDALELLSKSFTSSVVRDYAVSRLETASNDDLSHYLLQLVQALR
eukprot:TRINITY_DN4594_c0_g4_i2.p1 TRINITY_DN4594_c0_g4~~TRINITY_DN4594_c0_g4_i2.p1  ORF type:complete len:400 (-),score=86.60 TRINITY_DN4594_c0_g4_i2:220-1419(-)